MDIGALFLIIGVLILVIFFVGQPLLSGGFLLINGREHDLSEVLAERERVLDALQELDFDSTLGKIPEQEYSAQRSALIHRGTALLRQLDELEAGPTKQRKKPDPGKIASPEQEISDEDLEEMIAKRRMAQKEKAAGFCPSCGRPVQKSDRFCSACGGTLE